jgi:aspartyl aminopeptidase
MTRNRLLLGESTMNSFSVQEWTTSSLRKRILFLFTFFNIVIFSFCAVEALAESATAQYFSTFKGNVNCIALFNHEEIGSVSTTGAESSLIPTLLNRLSPTPGSLAQSISRSFLISSDMTHALHPSYTAKHEQNHKPIINSGIAIKTNAKQRYATDAISAFIVKQLVERKGGKVQEFAARNDM